MPTAQPEAAVATALAGAGGLGVSWVLGTNIFRQLEQPPGGGVPHHAIFVAPYGSPAPEPYLGTGQSFYRKHVQVLVRSPVGDPETGASVARSARTLLHEAALTGYVGCLALQSDPIALGRDATDHFRWSINFQLWIVE